MRFVQVLAGVALAVSAGCGGGSPGTDASMPTDGGPADGGALGIPDGGDASMAPDGGPEDAGALDAGCRYSNQCPQGQYCQTRFPADTCSNPTSNGPGSWVCGQCVTPGTDIVRCSNGDPYSGEPCDPDELPAGYVCRSGDCNTMCTKTCHCTSGRWDCSAECWDFLGHGDAGLPSCGHAPICWNNCIAGPAPGPDAGT